MRSIWTNTKVTRKSQTLPKASKLVQRRTREEKWRSERKIWAKKSGSESSKFSRMEPTPGIWLRLPQGSQTWTTICSRAQWEPKGTTRIHWWVRSLSSLEMWATTWLLTLIRVKWLQMLEKTSTHRHLEGQRLITLEKMVVGQNRRERVPEELLKILIEY